MTLRRLALTLVVLGVFLNTQAQNTNFRDEYLKRYDPQGYSNLKYAEGISEQGASLANALSRNLKNYQNLVDSEDPNEILADFNAKMQQIERLEDNYIQQSNSFAFEQGQQLGSNISSGNETGAFYGAVGLIGALNKSSRAKKDLAAKKTALNKQRRAAMSKVYYKAEEFNNNMIEQYIKRAAYAENLDDENYNLAFVEHLRCYGESMDKNWSSTNTYWLQNNCTKPRKPSSTGIENKFVGRDVQLAKVAKHKYALYEEAGNELFKEAAIAYAADAVKANPSAANYFLLGKYYKEESSILAMTCMLAAKEADENFFSGSKQSLFEEIEEETGKEIWSALANNKVEYIRAFIDAGLHRTVEVSFDSFFEYIIKMDKPDPLQLYLNKEFEGLTQSEIDKRLKGVIMLCAVHNSDACLQRFKELGTNLDFVLDGETPLQAADKSMSPDAYHILNGGKPIDVSNAAIGSLTTSKILLLAQSNPQLAAKHMDAFKGENEKNMALLKVVQNADKTSGYIELLVASAEAQKYLKERPEYMADLVGDFEDLAWDRDEEDANRSLVFLTSGLLEFKSIPNRADVVRLENKYIRLANNIELKEWEEEVAELKKAEVLRQKSLREPFTGTLTHSLMIDLLRGDLQDAYDKYVKSEYATEEGKRGMEEGLDIYDRMKANINSLSAKEIHELLGGMYWYVTHDPTGTHAKYSKSVYDLLVPNYTTQTPQTFAQRLDEYVKDLYKEKSEGTIQQSTIDFYEDQKGKEVPESTQKMITELFVMNSVMKGKKVYADLLKPLVEVKPQPSTTESSNSLPSKPRKPYLSRERTINERDSLNLAFKAYKENHMVLFNYLDEHYDLTKVKGENGVSLLEHMLFTEFAPNNKEAELDNRAAFFSKDFDFTKPINGVHPFEIYLNSDYREGYRKGWDYGKLRLKYFYGFLELVEQSYELDLTNETISENEGTMLHMLIDFLTNVSPSKRAIVPFVEFLQQRQLDKTVKDNMGRTAYDLYKENKKAVNKAIINAFYSGSGKEKEYKKRVAALVKND